MAAGPGRGPIKVSGSGTMAQGDLRGPAPRITRLAVSAVALVLGVPQLGHQLPGPGRHGPLAAVVHRSAPLTTRCHASSRRQQREASGGPGGGNEPPGRRTMRRNVGHGCPAPTPADACRLGLHSTMRAAALLPGALALSLSKRQAGAWVRWRRPSYLHTPRRPFVTDSLPVQSPVPWDSQSCELTRRFPKRTNSADKAGVRGQ
jgi:hypothetical protein